MVVVKSTWRAAMLLALCVSTASAQSPARLVKDINATLSPAGSNPAGFLTVGNTMYFSARLEQRGRGVWKTDGTPAGTVLVKDFGDPTAQVENFTEVAGVLYFTLTTSPGPYELWKSDGTAAGTAPVRDIPRGLGSQFTDFAALNGLLLFDVVDYGETLDLWRSDGTAEGTVMIAQLQRPATVPFGFNIVHGVALFVAADGAHGLELWRSDGTAAGTAMVKDIHPGPAGSMFPRASCNTAVVEQTLFFLADDGVNGCALWRSDGTEAGTVAVHSIPASRCFTCPVNVGGSLFLTSGELGTQLWKSDGTFGGTEMIRDFPAGSQNQYPANLTAVQSTLFFTAYDPISGTELWKSDGTLAGTAVVADIRPGPPSSNPNNLVNVDGTLFFVATRGPAYLGDTLHTGLWRSDGTEAGTVAVKDVTPTTSPSSAVTMAALNGTLLFAAVDVGTGPELWRSDGTEAGTALLKDINAPTNSSNPQRMTDVDGTLVLAADDGVNGLQLWRSDGTAAGTVRLTAVPAGQDVASAVPGAGFPEELASLNGSLLFPARQDTTGEELWITDGTVDSTRIVKDILPGPDSSQPRNFLRIGQTLFFTAAEPSTGRELWKSDGTEAGTTLVKDLAPGAASSNPGPMTALNGMLLFIAQDGSGRAALWNSDGTEGGTVALRQLLSQPPELTTSGGFAYFRNGATLWRTDGTVGGTLQLANLALGVAGLTDVNGILFFAAVSPFKGEELWRSDGTPAGTMLVKDINQGSGSGLSDSMPLTERAVVNDSLLFLADDGTHGLALWRSDGTETGTQMVKAIPPAFEVRFVGLHAVGAFAYFITSDPSGVRMNLWRTDGTEQGTVRVYNGPGDLSEAFDSAFVGSTFFFSPHADTPDHPDVGNELWALNVADLVPLVPCNGDCNQDGAVTVDELVAAVNIALGAAYMQVCPLVDTNDDGVVTVDELLMAVNQALNGCAAAGSALRAGG